MRKEDILKMNNVNPDEIAGMSDEELYEMYGYTKSEDDFVYYQERLKQIPKELEIVQMALKNAINEYNNAKRNANRSVGSVIYDAYYTSIKRTAASKLDRLNKEKEKLILEYADAKMKIDKMMKDNNKGPRR